MGQQRTEHFDRTGTARTCDAILSKVTSFKETRVNEWRMEMYNVLNHPNFANPSGSMTSTGFGTITSTMANARLIQFGLRLVY